MNQINDKTQQKKRGKRLFCRIGMAISAGLAYAVFAVQTGWYIPCLFRLRTGLRCPGCGISHMCTALLQFHWREAFLYNPAVFLTLPLLLVVGIRLGYRYIANGTVGLSKAENGIVIAMAAVLLIFGVVRNIIGI